MDCNETECFVHRIIQKFTEDVQQNKTIPVVESYIIVYIHIV